MTRLKRWLARQRPAFQRRTTYDQNHPWIVNYYQIPDALAWLIGFTVIRTDCLICGAQEHGPLRVWGADPEAGKRQLRQIVDRHQHRQMRWTPLYWRYPMANHGAWRAWREEQISRN